MKKYKYITLNEEPKIKELAAEWFHSKWGVPKEVNYSQVSRHNY